MSAFFRDGGDDERRKKGNCIWLGLLATESREGL